MRGSVCALQLPLLASPDYDPAVGRSGDLHHVQETLRQVAATLRSPTEWWLGAAANNACRTSLPGRQVQGMSAWTYAHLSVHQHRTVTKQPSGSSQPEPGTVHPPWLLGELAPGGQVWKDGNAPPAARGCSAPARRWHPSGAARRPPGRSARCAACCPASCCPPSAPAAESADMEQCLVCN